MPLISLLLKMKWKGSRWVWCDYYMHFFRGSRRYLSKFLAYCSSLGQMSILRYEIMSLDKYYPEFCDNMKVKR